MNALISFILATALASTTIPPITVQRVEPPVEEPNAKQEIYLAKLMDCESSGSTTIKVLDTNNKFSFGAYQYQTQTWLSQSKLYGLNYTEKDIYNYPKQKYLTHLILSDGGESHWTRPDAAGGRPT